MNNHDTYVAVFGGPAEVPELESTLASHGCKLRRTNTKQELLDTLGKLPVEVVLLILSKGHPERLALLQEENVSSGFPPIVVLTDCFDVDLYVEAMNRGAFDGLCVPLDAKELLRVVRAALAEAQSRRKLVAATA
jgi:DNA-binding NtrC family response regulator